MSLPNTTEGVTTVSPIPQTSTTFSPFSYNTTITSFNFTLFFNGSYYWPPSTLSPGDIAIIGYTPSYSYYSFMYYVALLLLVCIALIIAKIAIHRRQETQRQAALIRLRARRQQEMNVSNTELGINSANGDTKLSDLPPAYEEAVRAYINAKDHIQVEEGAVGGTTSSAAVSTLTIATDIESAPAECTTTTTIVTTTVTTNNETTQAPPSYEDASKLHHLTK